MDALYIIASIVLGTALIMGIIAIANRRFAPRFDTVMANNEIICLIQVLESSNDDLGIIVTRYYTLHIINASTGQRLFKKKLGHNDINVLQLNNAAILIQLNQNSATSFQIMDAYKWKTTVEYSNTSLPQLFMEFSIGVADEIRYDEERGLLKAYAKDGKLWFIEPFKQLIIPEDEGKNRRLGNRSVPRFSLEGDKIKYIEDYKTDHINKELPFIEGRMLAIDNEQRKFFITSYKTTDKVESSLYCLSYGQEVVWKTDPVTLNFKTGAKKLADFDVASFIDDKVFFNFGGLIFLANLDDGTIVWRNELS